jgi:hypothetical protein
MTQKNPTLFSVLFDFLKTPLTADELSSLNLPADAMRRLNLLIEAEKTRELNNREVAQLQAFKEAAFYLRMGRTA